MNGFAGLVKNKAIVIHVLLWALMVLYLFVAPVVKDKVTIVRGQPVAIEETLPQSSDQIRFEIEKFGLVKEGNQYLFRARGWTFIDSDVPQSDFEKYLVCSSEDARYFFLTSDYARADVEPAFPEIEANLGNAGFIALIANHMMRNGVYQVGFLYKNKSTGEMTYLATDQLIVKSSNALEHIGPDE
jgi:hypothetical protein